MAKSLRTISPKGVNKSKTEPADISDFVPDSASGNRDFAKKHKIEKHEDRAGNSDEVYKGKTKQTDMSKHGYKTPADEKVYESMKCESCGKAYEGESCGCGSKVPQAGNGKRGMLADKKKLDEVLTKKTPAKEVISDFVHSKNKMFKGDSKNQRIKRALGAYYGMHKENSDPYVKNLPPISADGSASPERLNKLASMAGSQPGKASEPTQSDKEKGANFESGGKKKIKEDLAMPMLEGGKKKKTRKESAPGDTPMRFPSGDVGDTGRV
jgi:hypothetical protein